MAASKISIVGLLPAAAIRAPSGGLPIAALPPAKLRESRDPDAVGLPDPAGALLVAPIVAHAQKAKATSLEGCMASSITQTWCLLPLVNVNLGPQVHVRVKDLTRIRPKIWVFPEKYPFFGSNPG